MEKKDTIKAIPPDTEIIPNKQDTREKSLKRVLKILMWVFFPVGLFYLFYKKISGKFKLDITSKTTLIFAGMFGVSFIVYAAFILFVVGGMVFSDNDIEESHVIMLVIVSVLAIALFLALFIALGMLASRRMLFPLRKMINKIDEISEDGIHHRLDPVDSQDELTELTERINIMLDSIENSFNQQKYFVSDASHELRTPISVIHGYAELLKRWGKDDRVVVDEAVDAIYSESNNMKHIVEQLLYLTKLGSFNFAANEFNIAEVVEDIVAGYSLTHPDKNITADIDIDLSVWAERAAVVELIRIITDNAIKYTAPGGNIKIEGIGRRDGAEIIISDDGIGISADDLPRIFDRFYRCDKSRGRESGSTGLGLAIAKSITEMMNGKISCESEQGEGTVFTIFIPDNQQE